MKQISTIVLALLVVAVGILFYLQCCGGKACSKSKTSSALSKDSGNANFTVAYFELDSLQNQYNYYKDVIKEINAKEQSVRNSLMQKKNALNSKIQEYQAQGKSMTQEQAVAAQQDVENRGRELQIEEQTKASELSEETRTKLSKIKKNIEDYLKVFNANKKYSLIIGSSAGNDMLYYKDTAYDITPQLVKGLNELYKKEKK